VSGIIFPALEVRINIAISNLTTHTKWRKGVIDFFVISDLKFNDILLEKFCHAVNNNQRFII
jgi:hypothetical protein